MPDVPQATCMMTPPEESVNVTLTTGLGPRFTRKTAKPWPGLQYRRRARSFSHVATAVPPEDVSSLPVSLVGGGADFLTRTGVALCAACDFDAAADDAFAVALRLAAGAALVRSKFARASSALTAATETCLACCSSRPCPS